MQITFQNCSLKIGYIGTPDEIMMAMLRDACQTAADAIIDFSRRYAKLKHGGRDVGLMQKIG